MGKQLGSIDQQQQDQFYAALAQAAPVGIFRTDVAGDYCYVSERWGQIAGLSPGDAEGQGWVQGLHPDDRDRVAAEWIAAVQTNRLFQSEYRFYTNTGQITWVYGQAAAERDASGKVVGYVGTITDISDRKQAELALRLQLEFDRLFVELSGHLIQLPLAQIDDGINHALGEIGKFTAVDACYIFQFAKTEPFHCMTHEWVAPGVASRLPQSQNLPLNLFPWSTAQLQRGETVYISSVETLPSEAATDRASLERLGIKSFLTIPLSIQGKVEAQFSLASLLLTRSWSEDDIRILKAFANILTNVLQRQRAESDLLESEQRFAALAKAVPVGIFRTDSEGRCLYVNEHWCRITGLSPETAMGMDWVDALHPADPERTMAQWQQAIRTRSAFQQDFQLRDHEGQAVWIFGQTVAEYNAKKQLSGSIGILTDITAINRCETDRQRIEGMLQQNEALLQLFVKYAPASIAMLDNTLCYINASQRWINDCGLSSVEDVVGQSHYDLFPEIPERWREIHQRCLRGAVEHSEEDLWERTDGTRQWLRWETRPWFIDNNEIGGILILTEDITERKQAELALETLSQKLERTIQERTAELQASEATLHAILNAIPDLLLRFKSDGTFVNCQESRAFYEDFPTDKKHISDVFPPELARKKLDLINQSLSTKKLQIYEQTFLRNDKVYSQEVRLIPIHKDEVLIIIRDIHDRKTKEKKLRQLHVAMEAAFDGILIFKDDVLIYTNSSCLKLFGYQEIGNLEGMSWKQFYPPNEIARFESEIFPLLKTHRYWEGEACAMRRDGSIFDEGLSLTLTEDSSVVCVCRDITARKQSEQALAQFAYEVEDLYNNAPCGYHSLDPEGQFIAINDTELTWFGYSREEMLGKRFTDFVTPESALMFHEEYTQFKELGWIQNKKYDLVCKNGSIFPVYLSATLVRDSNNNHISSRANLFDAREIKQAKIQLRNLSNRLMLALKSGEIGIWDWNISENILIWDDRTYKIYDVENEAFDQTYESWIRHIHPDDRSIAEQAIHQALSGEKDYSFEFRVLQRDGKTKYIKACALVQKDSQNKPQRMVGVNYDITNLKEAEINEKKISNQLAVINQELSTFSYSVSHDLRAPLRHLSGFVNALETQLKNYDVLSDQKVAHYLDVIKSSSYKMGQLIDGLLTLSRLGRRSINWQSVSLQDLVNEVIALALNDLDPHQVHPDFIVGNLPNVMGDIVLLQQVFFNLINNAVKFSSKVQSPRIEIGSNEDGAIWVKDNGTGFQSEYAEKLFGAFQRLHSLQEFEGTGIGLAIVQRIIHRHGGTIWAQGHPGQGATFYFKFDQKEKPH